MRNDPIEGSHRGSIEGAGSQEGFQPLTFSKNDGPPYPALLDEPSPL
jgi:hypothetical protein